MRVLTSYDDHEPVPWANGVGKTTEIVSLAESQRLTPGLRPWRLSIAQLVSTGPFSSLPGMARTFLPTAEVALTVGGQVHRVPRFTPLRFGGDDNVMLTGLSEPCFAVNLMVPDTDTVAPPRRPLTMTGPDEERAAAITRTASDEANRRTFLLTLEPIREYPRFQLLDVDLSETADGRLGGVLLC